MIMSLKIKILAIAGVLFAFTHAYAHETTDSSAEWTRASRRHYGHSFIPNYTTT